MLKPIPRENPDKEVVILKRKAQKRRSKTVKKNSWAEKFFNTEAKSAKNGSSRSKLLYSAGKKLVIYALGQQSHTDKEMASLIAEVQRSVTFLQKNQEERLSKRKSKKRKNK